MRDGILFNVENRSQAVSKHDERDHLEDYLSIRKQLKRELENYKQESDMRTSDQIKYHLKFFEDKIKILERMK